MKAFTSLVASMLVLFGGVGFAQDASTLAPTVVPPVMAPPSAGAELPLPPLPSGQKPLTKADVDAWLDGYMPYALHTGDLAGAVVTIVKDGQVLTARGFGYADAQKRSPVDPARTLFRPGSISKLVTWTAAMQMVAQGKLDLDRDVNAYLDFKIPPRSAPSSIAARTVSIATRICSASSPRK